jgi:hypothetical protein
MYRLHDRRIAERWAVRDDLKLMLQLGAAAADDRVDALYAASGESVFV